MRLRHHHRPPITQPSHHAHRHGLDTRQPCTQTEPGAREAQGEPEPATPDSQRPAEDSGAREEPAPEDARQGQHPAKAERAKAGRGRKASQEPERASTTREPPASPALETAPPPTPWNHADDLERGRERDRGEEREREENHSMTAPPSTCTR